RLVIDDKSEKAGEILAKDLISEDDAEKMQEYLREVVTKGSGKSAKDDDLAISGKTGTAELKQTAEAGGHQNGWSVGYPTEDTENRGTSSFAAGNVKKILVNLDK